MSFKKGQVFTVDKTAKQKTSRWFRDDMRAKDTVTVITPIDNNTFIGDDGWRWSPWMIIQNSLDIE